MKVKCYIFSGYKQRNNVFLVYLVGKLQQDGYGWCIFKLKCQNKQDTADVFKCESAYGKVRIAFLDSVNKQSRYSVCIYRSETSK